MSSETDLDRCGLAAHLGNNDPYVILLPHPSTSTLIRVISEIFVFVQKT